MEAQQAHPAQAPAAAAAGAGAGKLTYQPPPNEVAYYEALFVAADQLKAGQLGGREAVNFLSRSKLPMDYLRNIWTMADNHPRTNTLDKFKFFVAVRLIQLFQNGQTAADANLTCHATEPLRPPHFEGVTGVTIQPFATTTTTTAPSTSTGSIASPPRAPVAPPTQSEVPMSPVSHSTAGGGLPQVTTTLAVQDPYTMVPSEQSRYEALFPSYQQDGFVYGKEAVELFSKSGLANETLRDIWNMVDDPVDNRLDSLEFAMAMHLIVCISKKNLAVPPSLPLSLKALKQPPAPTPAPTPIVVETPNHMIEQHHQQQQQQPPQLPMPSDGSVTGNVSVMSTRTGGVSISDAFDDLNPTHVAAAGSSYLNGTSTTEASYTATAAVDMPTIPEQVNTTTSPSPPMPQLTQQHPTLPPIQQQQPQQQTAPPQMNMTMQMNMNPPPMQDVMEQPTVTDVSAAAAVGVAAGFAAASAPGAYLPKAEEPSADQEELAKMEAVLQKLRAENISLKAQMGQYTEEELEVRRQISTAITDIGHMSHEVAALRIQVSDAKAALIEATVELKAKTEQKEQLQDLMNEMTMTKEALKTSYDNVKEASEALDNQKQEPAPTTTLSMEDNLFGFDAPVPAPVPATTPAVDTFAPTPAPVDNFAPTPAPVDAFAPAPVPVDNYSNEHHHHQQHHVEAVSTFVPPVNADVMGGTVGSLQPPPPTTTTEPVSDTSMPHPGLTKEEVEDLKAKAQKAQTAARTAEDHGKALAIQLQEMQLAVEEAEQAAKEKEESVHGKKKGFGRNKKAHKEVEEAKKEAAIRKKNFEETQEEMSAAQAEIVSLNEKAEKLREEAEHAEIELAQQESIHTQMAAASKQAPPSQPDHSFPFPSNNGYSAYHPTTAPPTTLNNPGTSPMGGLFGGTQGSGMDNVMGSKPVAATNGTTSATTDYDNPFGF